MFFFFFSSRRRHTRCSRDWSSDVCSSDRIAIGERILEGSENDHPAALAPDIAVSPLVEGEAPSAPGKHRGAAKTEIRVGREQQVDAADDCGLDALAPNCFA